MVLLGLIGFLLLCIGIDAVIQFSKRRKKLHVVNVHTNNSTLSEKHIDVPSGIYFDKAHSWAFMDQSGEVKVGVDDFIQKITGKISRIETINIGDSLNKGDKIMSVIQNGKRFDIKSPLSGKLVAKNNSLNQNIGLINSSPYSDGWVLKIKPDKWIDDMKNLMMAEVAIDWMKKEFVRFKDFIVKTNNINASLNSLALTQDGGEIKENILSELGPGVWEEFQEDFLNKPL